MAEPAIYTCLRAQPCGHVAAMAPTTTPALVAHVHRHHKLLQLAEDDRWELVDLDLEPAVEAHVAGLNCGICAVDLRAFLKAIRKANPAEVAAAYRTGATDA